jgi:hypothetical protein
LVRNNFFDLECFFDPATREGNFLGKPLGRSASPQSKMTIVDGSTMAFSYSLPIQFAAFLLVEIPKFF